MSFEQLEQAHTSVSPAELRADQAAFSDEVMAEKDALQLVLGDVTRAEMSQQSKNGPLDWENFDNLYRALPVKNVWNQTEVARASLPMPVILEAVEKLMPALFLAFFSDKRPFLLEPLGRTTPEAAKANSHLLAWAIKQADFKEQIRQSLKGALVYGTTMARTGWKTVTKSRAKYSYETEEAGSGIKREVESYQISHPTFEHVEIRNILVDPGLREQDCRKARFLITQIFMDGYELDDLRDDPGYKNIPGRDELVEVLASLSAPATESMKGLKYQTWRDLQAAAQDEKVSVDPLRQPLEILEYVTPERIITVLQRCIVIRNEDNDGCANSFSCAFIDVPGSFYGFGVAKLLASEQLLQTAVTNKGLDALALLIAPSFTEEKGLGSSGSQQVKVAPGRILTSVGKLTPILVPDVSKPVLETIAASEARASRRVGANGGDNMPTQALRTAEGVNAFNGSVVDKLQYFIEIFAGLVFIPALESILEQCKAQLSAAEIKQILSEEEAKDWQGNILDVYNGKVSISVLSSTKLAARRAAAQLVPLLMQLIASAPFQDALTTQGKKFNMVEFTEETMDLAGWEVDSLIQPATPEDLQRAMAMRSGAAQAQGQMQLEEQQFQHQLQLIEANGEMRAGVKVVDHVLKESGSDGPAGITKNVGV